MLFFLWEACQRFSILLPFPDLKVKFNSKEDRFQDENKKKKGNDESLVFSNPSYLLFFVFFFNYTTNVFNLNKKSNKITQNDRGRERE